MIELTWRDHKFQAISGRNFYKKPGVKAGFEPPWVAYIAIEYRSSTSMMSSFDKELTFDKEDGKKRK